jgi:hypothetical protein
MKPLQPRSKYGAVKTTINGITFSSKAEARRYVQLDHLQAAGVIDRLVMQEVFELIPAQIINGKMERAVKYIADFSYTQDGKKVVEDVKGMKTREYIIKKKLLHFRHGVVIREINIKG